MIRRRAEHYETKTGHERWLVSYSDFITLLFAFFVMMYSVSQVSEEKYRVLSSTLASAFEGKVPVDAAVQERLAAPGDTDLGAITGTSPFAIAPSTKAIASQIQELMVNLANPNDVSIRATEEWVEIEVNANLLFPSARAEPSREAEDIFRKVAAVLANVPNEVEVSGHTDDVPIATAQFKSNWELSAARASSVVRLLAQGGVDPARLAAVGYGEFRPVADNNNEQGRAKNRRVVVKVARHVDPGVIPVPVQTFNPSEAVFGESDASTGKPSEVDVREPLEEDVTPASEAGVPESVEPVRLNHGGLLFSSDPELPRNRD